MSEKKENKLNVGLIKRILSYSKPYKVRFGLSLFLTLSLSVLAIIRPLLVSNALTTDVSENKSIQDLNTSCLIILGFIFFEAILQFVNISTTNFLGQSIVRDLRNQIYRHILKLKNTYFDNTPVGMLVTRAISDIESLSDVFSEGFIVIAGDFVMLLVFAGVMFWKNWVLALLVFTTIPLLFIATALFKNGVKKTFNEVRNAVSNLNTFTQEHITGMRIIQLFNKEKDEHDKFKVINQQHRNANIRSIFYYSIFFPVVEILSSVAIALVIWYAGVKSSTFHVTLGDLTFFVMLTNMMFRPIRMLADRLNTLQMGIVAADRVFKVLDTNEIIPDSGKTEFSKINDKILFKDLWFAYVNENFVLKNINLEIKKGERIAFVGATGSGKSTIINLLSRFYEYNKGNISIGGKGIEEYSLASLRKNTGVVLQDVFLFNDSIYNNITLHNPSINKEDVLKATKQIGLYDFIISLPGGFDYEVRERGISLSAGQRQLIAFIRAYVYNPEIFVLDEATASIDTPTEQLLQKATDILTQGRTSIIIAHRLSTIKNADKIIVMEKGEVIEQGNLKELLSTESKFKMLYEMQQGELIT
ncbi:MAG: ABC transporter ATP-binding protein [Sphingobacteriaceae bacterium]|nr:ABC transporter ATP-binding protein [Sphingobacteriaceae bacterium]